MRLLPGIPRVGDTREDEDEASSSEEDGLSEAMEEERWLATQEY